MKTFLSFKKELKQLFPKIVPIPELHCKWLNTLSFLENCGARKIAACEHPTLVKEEMLKHAAEEFRHAHYLKKQIEKVSCVSLENYSIGSLLGGMQTIHFLAALNIKACQYLSREIGLSKNSVKESAYLLVTYAIELRAEELYPIYDQTLREYNSKVTVKSILLEEKEHLQEMRDGICQLENGALYAQDICAIEGVLCKKWLHAISEGISRI